MSQESFPSEKRTMKHQPDNIENGVLHTVPSQVGESQHVDVTNDAVFGEVGANGPNYRNVGWLGTVALIMKTQVGLGILSIPAVFDSLGMVPGVVCLCVVAFITTWGGYIVGQFKLNHPTVYSIDDAGGLMFGRIGREIFGVVFCLFFIFVAGSAMLSISIAFNALSTHGACTAVFVAVSAIIGFLFSSICTLDRISWLAWIGMVGILASTFAVTIAVGVQDRPIDAPLQDGPWKSDFVISAAPSFTESISAICSLVFAYSCTPALFSIASEMREPRLFSRALIVCQSFVTVIYITIGCVVYYFCGSYVATPALGSAGVTIKKAAYGIALPGLVASLTLVLHFAAKYVFVRILRDSEHLVSNSKTHWLTWLCCTFTTALIAYLIASGIPVFGGLVSLIGAFLGTFMCFQPMGCMWLYDNWAEGRKAPTLRWGILAGWSMFVIISGTFLTIAGTYGSIVGIIESYKAEGGTPAWTCADNSNSV